MYDVYKEKNIASFIFTLLKKRTILDDKIVRFGSDYSFGNLSK